MAFKMYGKSPMVKKLIGKQANLPAELKAKIMATPESPAKMKKDPAMKMAKDPAMKMKKTPMEMKKTPMKMKKEEPMKMKKAPTKMKDGKKNLVKKNEQTDREKKITRNKEFNAHAIKTGLLPTFKSTAEKEKWYSNKANVNMLNKKQAEYFKKK